MARIKNYGFKVGDILRFNCAGLRCNNIPVRGPENKFVTVIEVESYTYRGDGQTQYFYRVRDNATGYVYDQNHVKDAFFKPTVINGLDGAYFTGKIYSRVKES